VIYVGCLPNGRIFYEGVPSAAPSMFITSGCASDEKGDEELASTGFGNP